MDVSQAIDVLISKSDTADLAQATRVIRESPIRQTIHKLVQTGFNPTEPIERREAAFVLLRGKLLDWNPENAEDEVLSKQIETELCKLLTEPTHPLLTWRAASVISAILSRKMGSESADDSLVQSISRSFETVASKDACSEEELFSTLNLLRAICVDGLPSGFAKAQSLPSFIKIILEKGFSTSSKTIVKLALDTSGAILEAYRVDDIPTPAECGDILGGVLQLVVLALRQVFQGPVADEAVEHLYLEYGLKAIMAGGSCDATNQMWNDRALTQLQILRDLCDVPKIANTPHFHEDVKVIFVEHVLDLVSAACTHVLNASQNTVYGQFLSDSFLYLMRCISLTPSAASIQQTIQTWELSSDLLAADTFMDVSRDYDDLCVMASMLSQDAFDKLVMFAKDPNPLKVLTFGYCENKLKSTDPCEAYGAWVALATLLSSIASNTNVELPSAMLAQFVDFAVASLSVPDSASDSVAKFMAARSRWAALHLINEVVKYHGENVGTSAFLAERATQLGEFYLKETCVKVKVTSMMAIVQIFCHLADNDSDALKPIAAPYFANFLEPEVVRPSTLVTCLPLMGTFAADKKPFTEAEQEIRELLFSAMTCLVVILSPAELATHYRNMMPICLTILRATPMDQQGLKLGQCVLNLATRMIESITVVSAEDEPARSLVKELVDRATEDAVTLMKNILIYNDLFATADKSALPACGPFESCLLQGAARIISFTEECQIPWTEPHLGQVINELSIKKLRTLTAWEITDRPIALNQEPSNRMCQIESFTENETRFTVTQSDGTQKLMTINTSNIEQQVACLSFIGVASSKILQLGSAGELKEILSVLRTVLVRTIFPQVRDAGFSALGDLIGIMTAAISKAAIPPVSSGQSVVADTSFRETFQAYTSLWVDITNIFIDSIVNTKSTGSLRVTKIVEFSHLMYLLGDMGDGFRDTSRVLESPIFPSAAALLTEAQQGALMNTVRRLLETCHNILIQCNKTETDVGLDDAVAEIRGADKDELRKEELDVLCDAVMQVVYRLMVGLGAPILPAFEEFMKPLYAFLLASGDTGPISRTAAIVLMSHYYGLGGCPGEVPTFLQAMIALTRSSMDPNVLMQIQGKLPGVDRLHELADSTDVEILRPLAPIVLPNSSTGGGDTDELLDDWKSDFKGEVMRIQAACFGVGVGAEVIAREGFLQHVPAIQNAFLALITHPLVTLPCRRVILDCLGCATLRIIRRFGDQLLAEDGPLFNVNGIGNLLETIFPLVEDAEDAQMAHDILIRWTLEGGGNPAMKTWLPKICKILTDLGQSPPSNELVSFVSLHGGRLENAQTAAEAMMKQMA